MSTLTSRAPGLMPPRRAASLAQMASWRLLRMWAALERHGRRRAAPALAQLAATLRDTDPALARHLGHQARAWQAQA